MRRKCFIKQPLNTSRFFQVCIFALSGLSTQALAESRCVSLFSKIADQFNKVVPTYIDIRMEAAEVLVPGQGAGVHGN